MAEVEELVAVTNPLIQELTDAGIALPSCFYDGECRTWGAWTTSQEKADKARAMGATVRGVTQRHSPDGWEIMTPAEIYVPASA